MRRRSGAGTAATLIAACVFGAALLLSLITGAGVYRQVQARADSAAEQRLGLAYITAKLHAADAADSVSVERFGGVDALCLSQSMEGTEFLTLIYVYDGWLRELFCERGYAAGLGPEAGQQITEARALTAATPEPGFLRLAYTDGGGVTQTASVSLRSVQNGG